jgi:hypothetical protein
MPHPCRPWTRARLYEAPTPMMMHSIPRLPTAPHIPHLLGDSSIKLSHRGAFERGFYLCWHPGAIALPGGLALHGRCLLDGHHLLLHPRLSTPHHA